MGEFKEASLWMRLALLFIIKGFALLLFAFVAGLGAGGWSSVEACNVIGFLGFLTAVVLALGLIFLDELKANKIALICLIVFALIAGLAVIIGLALWAGNLSKQSKGGGDEFITYASMLGAVSGLLGLLSGIFATLEIAGAGAK